MARSVNLLLIDEAPGEKARIADALRPAQAGLEIREAPRRDDFARALEAPRWDLAIVDRRLSWSCGLKLGGILRDRYPNCPLLMHAPEDRVAEAVAALRAGFDDYVPKSPGRPRGLFRAVEALMEGSRLRKRETWVDTRLQDLLGRLDVGVYRSTARGTLLYANAAFCRIFGMASWREAPAWSLRSAMADPPEEARIARELRRTGFTQGREVRLKGPDGREQWISLTQRVQSGSECLDVVEGLVEDITDRKGRANAARRREEELGHHQRLETVGRLAGGVAHDFNNMLTAINGYSELLLDHLPGEHPLRESVVEISKAGSRAADLTRQLLAFSSRLMLFPRRADLNGFIQGLTDSIREALGPSILLHSIPGADAGWVFADMAQLRQAVMGLIHNARDSMPDGGTLILRTGRVTVSGEEGLTPGSAFVSSDRLRPGEYGLLIIEDSGTGMEPEVLSHVFEPFFTTKPQGKGLGMGLSTAYGIIKQSGGAIVADSLPGRGTRMRLYLPMDRPGQEARVPAS